MTNSFIGQIAGIALAACLGAGAAAGQGPARPGPAPAPAPVRHSQDAEADRLFNQGQEMLAHGDPRTGGSFANARAAIALYEQALAHDPRLALAYVQIARAWQVQGYSNPDAPPGSEIERQSRTAVERALAIDPELPEAHAMLAQLLF